MAYPHGLFTWADVSVPDPAGGSKFYAELFGWDAADQHDPDGNYIYTMFHKNGKAAAGLAQLPAEVAAQGAPPAWTSYITVDNVDDAVAAWTAAGGNVVMPVMDVMTSGRMAVVADPQGAVVAFWQAGDSVGGEVFGEPGAMSWNELATRDSASSRDFYLKVLGWGFEKFEAPDQPDGPEYWTIQLDAKESGQPYRDDKFNGGVITMDDTWPAEIPSHWMVYFTVADTDDTVGRLEALGGSVRVPPFDTSAGRISVVADPQGAIFSVISMPDTN